MFKKVYLICFLSLISCKQKNKIPQDSYIITRYTVFDEIISPKLNVCPSDSIYNFTENNGEDCLFRLEENIFEVEFKITLSTKGHMIKLDQHSVTNKIDYKKFGIVKDSTDYRKVKGDDFFIRFSKSKNEIIDGIDTLTIEKIFPNEKLIFVENTNAKKGRRHIYQYN